MIFSEQEMSSRMIRLKESMQKQKFDLALIMYASDIYYLSGVALHSMLVVPLGEEPSLFVQVNLSRAEKDCWLKNIRPSVGIPTVARYLRERGLDRGTIGIESDVLPVQIYQRLARELPGAKFKNISPLIISIRSRKSPGEVDFIKSAARISNHGFKLCRELIRPGKSEIEIRLAVGLEELKLGGELPQLRNWNQNMQWGVFASGENTTEISGYWMCETGPGTTPFRPYGPSLRKLGMGDTVCVNKGIAVHGYNVDEARTFVVGKATAEQKKVFTALCRAQEAMIKKLMPGVTVKDIYFAGRQEIDRAGYGKYFMTGAFYDFPYVGHGVGLEVDEPPLLVPPSEQVLEEGMVLAFEPKIIVPGWGGMDLEDTVLITAGGSEVLTLTEWELFEV